MGVSTTRRPAAAASPKTDPLPSGGILPPLSRKAMRAMVCTRCGEEKPPTAFSPDAEQQRLPECRMCSVVAARTEIDEDLFRDLRGDLEDPEAMGLESR